MSLKPLPIKYWVPKTESIRYWQDADRKRDDSFVQVLGLQDRLVTYQFTDGSERILHVDTFRSLYEKAPFQMTSQDQGGFSDAVAIFLQQTPIILFGWVGHGVRTEQYDRILETAFREKGVMPFGIAEWAKSKSGRQFGDTLDSRLYGLSVGTIRDNEAFAVIRDNIDNLVDDIRGLERETGEVLIESKPPSPNQSEAELQFERFQTTARTSDLFSYLTPLRPGMRLRVARFEYQWSDNCDGAVRLCIVLIDDIRREYFLPLEGDPALFVPGDDAPNDIDEQLRTLGVPEVLARKVADACVID